MEQKLVKMRYSAPFRNLLFWRTQKWSRKRNRCDEEWKKMNVDQIIIIESLSLTHSLRTDEIEKVHRTKIDAQNLYNFIWLKFENLWSGRHSSSRSMASKPKHNCLIGFAQFLGILVWTRRWKKREAERPDWNGFFFNHRLIECVIKFSWSIAILLYLWRHY